MAGFCRVLVEFNERDVTLYLCNRAGKVIDEEVFVLPSASDRDDAEERARQIHAAIYDCLNYDINGSGSSDADKQK
jgi:hypothetical protein